MIKSLYIDNFKALNEFQIEFQALTLLIGANSVGKSTILQALELLAYFTQGKEYGELNNYLKQQDWLAKDLKSTLSKRRYTAFIVTIKINEQEYFWSITLEAKQDRFELVSEVIEDKTGYIYLHRTKSKAYARSKEGEKLPLVGLSFVSSGLSLMDEQSHKTNYPELIAIKKTLNGLALFDFSSTHHLKSANLTVKNVKVGRYGENLAAYLYQLSKEDLKKLSKSLQVYVPFFESVRIIKKSREEIEIDIKETFNNSHIDAPHLSDGMMRLLGILTLALTNSGYQTLLIEEIEDGINPNLAGEVIKTLLNVTENTHRQFILTTHNPLILDWVPVENIHFLYRTENGQVKQKSFSDSSTVLQNLDYMNPGEIWINFEEKEILDSANQ